MSFLISGAIQINITVTYTKQKVYLVISSDNEIDEIDWYIDELSPLTKIISTDKKTITLIYKKTEFMNVYPYEIINESHDYMGNDISRYILRRVVFGRYVKEEETVALTSYLALTGSLVSLGALAYVLLKNSDE